MFRRQIWWGTRSVRPKTDVGKARRSDPVECKGNGAQNGSWISKAGVSWARMRQWRGFWRKRDRKGSREALGSMLGDGRERSCARVFGFGLRLLLRVC